MRKAILAAATLAVLSTMTSANAQDAVGGAIVGAGAGAETGAPLF